MTLPLGKAIRWHVIQANVALDGTTTKFSPSATYASTVERFSPDFRPVVLKASTG